MRLIYPQDLLLRSCRNEGAQIQWRKGTEADPGR